MALSKLKKFVTEEVMDENNEDEYYDNEKAVTSGNGKMILLEPRAYSESQQIADHLKKRNTVVVNMKRVTPDQAKRIVDFFKRYSICSWRRSSKNRYGNIFMYP